MTDDDEEIRLRDQFAIAAMQSLVEKEFPCEYFIQDRVKVEYCKLGKSEADYWKYSNAKIERLTTVAYKIADAMRKARLQSFK